MAIIRYNVFFLQKDDDITIGFTLIRYSDVLNGYYIVTLIELASNMCLKTLLGNYVFSLSDTLMTSVVFTLKAMTHTVSTCTTITEQ